MPMPQPLVAPPLLAPGARVALVAPAGPLGGSRDVEIATRHARELGWDPVVAEHARAKFGYFAGTDEQRLADLRDAMVRPDVDAIWCIRGGYGAMRLLEGLDYDAFRRRPKPLIGYSDVTALHAAVNARCGVIAHHGPTARQALTDFARNSLVRAVVEGTDPCGAMHGSRTLRGGRAVGRLAGGNLALVAALCGTPYAVSLEGAIAVFEDVNEHVYRIDRMLQQLLLGGGLRKCAGIVFGGFTSMPDKGVDAGRRLDQVLAEVAEAAGVPCVMGAPFGHIDDQWTLPLGAVAALDADACTLNVLA